MGPILASLFKLQGIEHDLTHVRRRLRSKENAVRIFQDKIDELAARHEAVQEQLRRAQTETDRLELERRSADDEITHLRGALNRTKTNKEYAAILTQINTIKADNSKLEDQILKTLEGIDALKGEDEAINAQTEAEQKRLDQVRQTNAEEVAKLNILMADLQAKRGEAATAVSPDILNSFERLASAHEGKAMARIDVVDERRGQYICGSCYMKLNAEHFNALLSKDEIRHCDSCGCILYIEPESVPQK